jgi:ATP-dependent helicase/nuclease subunit A
MISVLQPISHPDPNVNQRAASDPLASVWVNASAGSGKTKVLTDRVTRLLLSGVRPEKILCLTYTRAGAAEMANRVTGILSKWAVCEDAELDNDLDKLQNEPPTSKQRVEARRLFARVLSCPGGLRIRTIHSFCQEILSRFPIEAGLPPHFALIDEQEVDVLNNEVLDDLLREAAAQPEQKLAQALNILIAAQGETGFIKMLQEVMHARGRIEAAIAAAGSEKNLINQTRNLLQLEPEDTPKTVRANAMSRLPEAELRQLAAWLAQGSKTHLERSQVLAEILATSSEERAAKFDAYRLLFLTKENEPRKAFANKEILQKHPEIDETSQREAARIQSILERIEAAEIAEVTSGVLTFGFVFAKRLSERKAARAAVDYDDLIMFTENLLHQSGIAPWILYKLDNGLDHILVDEAQDTSRAQWNIVQSLTQEFYAGAGARDNNRTLFVVGDEKQSIFSFQNADPAAFHSFRNIFSRDLEGAGKTLEKIGLHVSFRSAKATLDAVDAVFALDAVREGVSQDPVSHTSFSNRIGRVEVWPILKQASNEADKSGAWILPTGYEEERDPQAELAQQIAMKIKNWLTQRDVLPGADRPIAPDDIMILLRRRGRFADLMVRALKANKIPVTGVDRMHLINQLPVMDLLAMLRFVLLPEDNLNLATLLRSPLLGLSEEQLMELAIGREGSLWQSVKTSPLFAIVHDYLSAKLSEADFSTPFAFLSHILNAPCPANADSGRKALWARLGDEALDPIEELLNEAQSFGRSHSPSLQNFLRWLTQADAEIKRELDRGGGQVRIMTVHASKGLEAPIVFLPDTTAVPRTVDIPKFQWGENDTPLFLPRTPDFGAAARLWQAARERQMEEYRRLFYVALTRAANRLYICGWVGNKNEGDLSQSWYGLAASALHPLHQEHLANDASGPIPEIAFADAVTSLAAPLQTRKPSVQKTPLPAWALRQVEAQPAVIHLVPSQESTDSFAATPDAAFARGRIIHRLLQSLPDIDPARRIEATQKFLAQPRHALTPAQREEIAAEVNALLNDEKFSTLFAPDSLAEAPLTGNIDGVNVFRQVDRLCLRGDEVWIVDYKTNRPPPANEADIPASYRRQLNEYRTLLRGIYPDKKLHCFLLWTYAPRLMEVVF